MRANMNGCLFLCVPAVKWKLLKGVILLAPQDSWDRLQHPRDPECREKR